MCKAGLGLLILVVAFAFGSVKTYAQCADPVQWYCPCTELWHDGFLVESGGGYYPQSQVRCCNQIVPNIYNTGSGTCFDSARNITKTMHTELAKLALQNRVFLVTCNGDLALYQDNGVAEQTESPTWSANRALLSYEGKQAIGTR